METRKSRDKEKKSHPIRRICRENLGKVKTIPRSKQEIQGILRENLGRSKNIVSDRRPQKFKYKVILTIEA